AEGVQHTAEARLDDAPVIARDLEGLDHDVRAMVPDRARGELDAVADDVILIALDLERIFRLERLETALRHGEGVMAEVDLLLHLVIFVHREVDDPAEVEHVLLANVELLADTKPR